MIFRNIGQGNNGFDDLGLAIISEGKENEQRLCALENARVLIQGFVYRIIFIKLGMNRTVLYPQPVDQDVID